MKEKQEEIIKNIDELKEIKTLRSLKEKIFNNPKYIKLIEDLEEEKYIKDGILNDKILELRREMFEIDELNEYLKIQTNIRLLSVQINNIIKSIVDDKNC